MNTFQKRKKSLLKKISEFSILCGVEACLIIFGPKQKDEQVIKLEATWPSNPDEIKRIINKYKRTDQARRCYHVSDYFADKKKKVDVEISKLHKQIFEANFPLWDVRLDSFLEDQLRVLMAQLDEKLEIADKKLDSFHENQVLMDEFASRMLYSSQNMEMNRSNSFRNLTNLHQLFSDVKPLDAQLPVSCFLPGQSSYMIPSNSNLMENSNSSYSYSTNLQLFSDYHVTIPSGNLMDRNNNSSKLDNLQLQLFSDPKPLDVQLPMHFQNMISSPGTSSNSNLLEDLMMMSKDQNIGNQYGDRPISNIQSISGLPYVPSSWTWGNVMLDNVDASTSNVGSTLQTILPQMQLPMLSFSDQMNPSQEDNF
ncbi:hypothetical protein GH714_041737 [Hevea brasiliensis]|uniref:MADS-box domain-containing protein n=1 Tax=Hevea brasiliensis TaxID=3981 RepID=A0A6A6MVR0_HEVBR|nr:hypothetical protein GH714_041737 [Hevea brasiliensis]